MSLLYIYFCCAIILDHAHLACPMSLAWSNAGFRREMLAQWEKFILWPLGLLVAAVVIGLLSPTTRDLSFRGLALTYFWWNAWHFGSQHFGVASLLGWRSGRRWMRQLTIVGATMLAMALPVTSVALVAFNELLSFCHWTTDIGLSTWIARKWPLFLGAILIVGLTGFLWKTTATDPRLCGLMPACTAVYSIPALLGLRYGLGFVHFLYSRWIWQREARMVLASG